MIALTVGELAALLGVQPEGPGDRAAAITLVTADSRAVGPGALFAALPGEHVDGHRFVPAAAAAGAVAALTREPVPDCLTLPVADPLAALGRLARYVVDQQAAAGLQVVGITGSVGKTSTKDLLAQVLERFGPTVAPVGNLNNELGVPLTVSRLDERTRFLVAEMGARGIGHIAYLCRIAPPRIGVVLNVGQAHVGEFGGQQAIAKAKGELAEAVPPGGWAVLNRDDPLVWPMRHRAGSGALAFSVVAPPRERPAVWAEDLVPDGAGRYGFVLHTAGFGEQARVAVQLRLTGRHQVANAVAAAAAAYALGLDPGRIGAGLSEATARSRWRMEVARRSDGVVVLNDAYNANPDSMRAAVSTLAELGATAPGRTWAVLGDMLELGGTARTEHVALGGFAARSGVDRLVLVGEFAPDIASGARRAGMTAPGAVTVHPDKAAATAAVLAGLGPGDVVLVKASRGLALDTVSEELLAAGDASGATAGPA